MKTLHYFSVLLLLLAVFTFSSCENEPIDSALLDSINNGGGTGGGTGGGGGTTGYYFRVKKDGVLKQFTSTEVINSLDLNSFVFLGAENTNSLSLTLFDISAPGIYQLDYVAVSCAYTEGLTIYNSNYLDGTASPGNVTILEINRTNKTIKGTFNFIGKNEALTSSRVFTNGEFYLKYTEQ